MSDTFGIWAAIALVVAFVGAVAFCASGYEAECTAKGGHTKYLYKTVVCLTADGRILE